MSPTIQARLDPDTATLRDELRRRLGMSDSDIVREGIKALAPLVPPSKPKKFAGQGKYETGISDLSTNKKYLEGLGE